MNIVSTILLLKNITITAINRLTHANNDYKLANDLTYVICLLQIISLNELSYNKIQTESLRTIYIHAMECIRNNTLAELIGSDIKFHSIERNKTKNILSKFAGISRSNLGY